jgi:hypothetical protein
MRARFEPPLIHFELTFRCTGFVARERNRRLMSDTSSSPHIGIFSEIMIT